MATSSTTARTSFTAHPTSSAVNSSPAVAAAAAASASSAANAAGTPLMSPELEQTLSTLSSHRSVLGYLLLSRTHPVSIIRNSGVIFEGEQGRKYAGAVGRIVESVRTGLEEVAREGESVDDVRFLRIRTKRHEIMISPDERYVLAVLHDPTS